MREGLAISLAALLLGASPALANPATETEHVVEEGETLGGIANRAGVPAAVIAAANGLVEPTTSARARNSPFLASAPIR